jgi:asparagine synthase (glutamine-hydrolysing)
MCGIAGLIDFTRSQSNHSLRELSLQMARTMRHRGPDDEGVWADERAGIALAMRRLSILDTSATGHQPMRSQSGRYVLVTNGEIYNFKELREELASCAPTLRFLGHSDTEVMLAAFEHWGVNEALSHFNGMFAFALWDRLERVLHLGRDRFGEKPLYYSRTANGLLFSSELKALRVHPDFKSELDHSAIALFLRYNCIPSPFTIYRGTAKLPPGKLLSFNADTFPDATPHSWWSAAEVARKSIASPFQGSEDDAAEHLDMLLRDAVRIRMRSDVPVGAFLSGGVDSSAIVALMQAQSATRVNTFSIGVHDRQYNEASEAARVAQHLSTDHTELYVTPAEVQETIPRLASIYDEPFADSSQIPTYLVARLARQKVTVSLSGDGGDELLGGTIAMSGANYCYVFPKC